MTHIENSMLSSFRYGNAKAIYSSYQSHASVGNLFAAATKSCESDWEKFWGDVEVVFNDIVNVAAFICKFEAPIMMGTAAVGFPEAVPIEEKICEVDAGIKLGEALYDEAMHVITAINEN